MSEKIRVGVVGYGNLGKGACLAIAQSADMELVGVFSRRDPATVAVGEGIHAYTIEQAYEKKDEIDVLILCGGSATDLPKQGPAFAAAFHTVDSFDTHAKIPAYFEAVDQAAKASNHTSIISVGWDPGLFSLNRLYGQAVLPDGEDSTFWGKGISQGHSDAIRRIEGVLDAKQYTIPIESAIEAAREGNASALTARQKHLRECFVVTKEGADQEKIAKTIQEMPNYFADYDTTVHFVSAQELQEHHSKMPHGGFVLRSGRTGVQKENRHLIEYALKLDSNPEFTSSVLVAYARAAVRLAKEGSFGGKTVLDVPPAYLSAKSAAELRKELL